jgi:hypothetical protein
MFLIEPTKCALAVLVKDHVEPVEVGVGNRQGAGASSGVLIGPGRASRDHRILAEARNALPQEESSLGQVLPTKIGYIGTSAVRARTLGLPFTCLLGEDYLLAPARAATLNCRLIARLAIVNMNSWSQWCVLAFTGARQQNKTLRNRARCAGLSLVSRA